MVEGDFWIHGQTDLGDLYRDEMTLRQTFVRLIALPHESRTWTTIRDEAEREQTQEQERELRSMLAQFQPPKG